MIAAGSGKSGCSRPADAGWRRDLLRSGDLCGAGSPGNAAGGLSELQNAIILLSDGDATACASNAYTTGGACNTKSEIVATEGTLNGTGTSTTNASHYKDPTFPSALGECGQAVLAAQVRGKRRDRRCTRSDTAHRHREVARPTRPTALR